MDSPAPPFVRCGPNFTQGRVIPGVHAFIRKERLCRSPPVPENSMVNFASTRVPDLAGDA